MRFICFYFIVFPFYLFSEPYTNPTAPNELLRHYAGDFTDSDNDGMTDFAEKKYGYDHHNKESFPRYENRAAQPLFFPIVESRTNNAVIRKVDSGILIEWDDHDLGTGYSRYSLTLNSGNKELYYGGHGWGSAMVDYLNFNLNGTEILTGRFSEYDQQNGEFVSDGEWFQIDLTDYPVFQDNELGTSSDQITFRFEGFNSDLQVKYENFLGKVLPIFIEVAGFPAETFVCTFKLSDGGYSWVTLDQGRTVLMDESWIPRLFIHELIHVWKGKYAFSYTGESWSYEEKLNGFEETAEGLAYEILHKYAEAYPNDETSLEILRGGPWWNWPSHASNYDTVKHQPHTGAGTFWSGEALFSNDRYSLSAMLIQIIHAQDPDFFKRTMKAYYQLIESNPQYRPTREGLLDLWSSQIKQINGIDSRTYLNALPVLNGEKLTQRYFPVIYQSESYSNATTKIIFGSYALQGNLWWFSGNRPDEIGAYNIPSWVKYNQNTDGYLYVDSNNQPYHVAVKNIFGKTVKQYDGVLDSGYQDEQKTIPNNLFSDRIPELNSQILPPGLYIETLAFKELVKHTDHATQSFYTFGYQGFSQSDNEYTLFIGIDSMFPSRVEVTFDEHLFDLAVENGCAVLKTSLFPLNSEGILTIKAHSQNGESHLYQRALVNAGSYDGMRHQQFLIIDRDFDGLEDLYDQDVNEQKIAVKYEELKQKNKETPVVPTVFSVTVNQREGGKIIGAGQYREGQEITLQATPSQGYKFVRWSGSLTGESSVIKHTVLNDVSVSAIFSPISDQENISHVPFWLTGEDKGNNWKHLEWFGYYYLINPTSAWIYHTKLGWIYLIENNTDSFWSFIKGHGWVWSKKDFFSRVYQSEGEKWIFLHKDKYFDYSIGEWVE